MAILHAVRTLEPRQRRLAFTERFARPATVADEPGAIRRPPRRRRLLRQSVEIASLQKSAAAAGARLHLRAIRELMLLQSSDWAFMIRVGDFVEYANGRAREHAQLLERLIAIATHDGEVGASDAEVVAEAQRRHPVFDELDEDAWADVFDAFE